jgi:hypothetical protein
MMVGWLEAVMSARGVARVVLGARSDSVSRTPLFVYVGAENAGSEAVP